MPVNYEKPIEIRDFRGGEWFWIHSHIWRDKNLSKSDKLVYGTLASYANLDQTSFPSVSRIAKDTDISERQVYFSIKSLEKQKYIVIERKLGKPNYYTLISRTPETIAPLKKMGWGGEKNGVGTPEKNGVLTISSLTISNNNKGKNDDLINKITLWAYTRSRVVPSISQDKFRESVARAIEKHGIDAVYKHYAEEDNAIQFLVNIK
jgi:hypothetical protein